MFILTKEKNNWQLKKLCQVTGCVFDISEGHLSGKEAAIYLGKRRSHGVVGFHLFFLQFFS